MKATLLILVLSVFLGCDKKSSIAKPEAKSTNPITLGHDQEGSGFPKPSVFQAKEASGPNEAKEGKRVWLATHTAAGKSARFRIELALKQPSGNSPFAFVKGTFYREKETDGSEFLKDLLRALEAKALPQKVDRVDKLPFTAAVLGSYPDEEGFIRVKVFLADGAGEVFLNLNPERALGEFSIKDPEYGDLVVREIAKLF